MTRAAAARTAVCLLLIASGGVAAAQRPVNLQVALDRPVDFSTPKRPIAEVFQLLTKASGVPFVIDADLYDCLPYGEHTRMVVQIPNRPLREALPKVLDQNGMGWTIEGQAVRIVPSPALLRMVRRATEEEMAILGSIYAARMQPTKAAGSVLDQLRKATGNKDLSLLFHRTEADEAAAQQRAERVLPAPAAAWLDMLCHGKGWTWYLWGDAIMIVDKKVQVGRQLQREVSLRYDHADLATVLLDLARKAHVKLNMSAGVMDFVPVETRENFSLIMSDATIAQALEVIQGATGLVFLREAEGLRVEASDPLKQRAAAATKKTPFFLKKTLHLPDGSTVDLLLRPEDLPEDVVKAIEAERAKLYELLIRKYRPTTQPAATQPSK